MLHGLDAEQRQAVTATAAPLAIVAAAGSGKTTVLTRRIAYRVAHGTAMAQHVLALTFTRDAAAELKRRLRKLEIREPIEAGTTGRWRPTTLPRRWPTTASGWPARCSAS